MLFFFVFGIVLIARISLIGEIAGRAGVYAAILGVLVWFGLMKYVTYAPDSPVGALRGLLNVGLIVLAWWCVNRLVRDCTEIDDRTRVDSRGLLQAAGLEELDVHAEARRKQVPEASRRRDEPEEAVPEPRGWYQRWQRYREERQKHRTPGVTVIYFSLAALPLFGLGQSLIPAAAGDRRRYAFWLLTIYVGSGLGLLLTTSFLGLRRYLNQRKLKMPPAMTAVWLSLGGALIAVLLLLGAFLPRPLAEYPLIEFTPIGSETQAASQHAVRGEDQGEGEGRAASGNEGKDDKKGSSNKDQAGKNTDKGSGKDKGSEKGAGKEKKAGDKDGKEKGPSSKEKDGGKGESSKENADTESPATGIKEFFRSLAPVLKWIVFGVIALLVVFFVLRSGLKWLANFFEWARNLLDALCNFFSGLFGGWVGSSTEKEGKEAEAASTPPRPFADFSNPFTDGTARGLSPRELVRYTFAAFEAWAPSVGCRGSRGKLRWSSPWPRRRRSAGRRGRGAAPGGPVRAGGVFGRRPAALSGREAASDVGMSRRAGARLGVSGQRTTNTIKAKRGTHVASYAY